MHVSERKRPRAVSLEGFIFEGSPPGPCFRTADNGDRVDHGSGRPGPLGWPPSGLGLVAGDAFFPALGAEIAVLARKGSHLAAKGKRPRRHALVPYQLRDLWA
jgi:hypothetical protein